MANAKQLLYEMLVEEFSQKPDFLMARTLFLFCHFNPGFEVPKEVMPKFIQGLMEYEVRAFCQMSLDLSDNTSREARPNQDEQKLEDRKRAIFNEITAENLSAGTGKTYTPQMMEVITRRFNGLTSYNEILEKFIIASAHKKAVNRELSEFSELLKNFPVFAPLSNNDFNDLFSFLQLKSYNKDELILRKGTPGTNLYIILAGNVEVVNSNGESVTFLETGSVFGEMSLLTGAPVSTSVYSRSFTKLATLTSRDFKQVLHRYPILNVFFYNLLIERTGQASKKVAGDISTGMSGELSDVYLLELFRFIHTSKKTGSVKLKLKIGFAKVYFNEGEIVYAELGKMRGRQAIFALLGATSGQFVYTPWIPSEAEKYELIGGFMGLVMEGMKRLDEK